MQRTDLPTTATTPHQLVLHNTSFKYYILNKIIIKTIFFFFFLLKMGVVPHPHLSCPFFPSLSLASTCELPVSPSQSLAPVTSVMWLERAFPTWLQSKTWHGKLAKTRSSPQQRRESQRSNNSTPDERCNDYECFKLTQLFKRVNTAMIKPKMKTRCEHYFEES